MPNKMKYIPGDHLMDCDECGFTYRRSQIARRWDGAMVCFKKCWEPRHPQERVPNATEKVGVDVYRKNATPSDTFIPPERDTTISFYTGIAGYMIVGLGIVGNKQK